MRIRLLIMLIGAGIGRVLAQDTTVTVAPVSLPVLPLGLVTLSSGKSVNISVSPGAGAFRSKFDPPNLIWTITDRGPTIDCTEERDVAGSDDRHICLPDVRGKIYLLPGFAPSIYSIDIGEKSARFVDYFPLKSTSGRPISGIVSPYSTTRAELAYGIDGSRIDSDPSGIEPGGIVRLANGTFWVAEEFGPSLLEISADGTVLRRIVPAGSETDFKGADYPVQATLPAIARQRQVNRGFDGLALSPDSQFLYVAMANAPTSPDIETYRHSPIVRIWKIRLTDAAVTGQYLYALDPPESYAPEPSIGTRKPRQSDVRIVEITAVGEDRLLVLERIRHGSKIYRVDLTSGADIPASYNDGSIHPAPEEIGPDRLAMHGLKVVEKTLIIDSERAKGLSGRLSSMAALSDRELLLINNNDFGIDGGKTQMFRLTFSLPVLK